MKNLLPSNQMATVMGSSKFCLVPRGRAAWSVRFFETLWTGCVPVILSDHFEVPFETLFDVSKFTIKWPVNRIDESLYSYLRRLAERDGGAVIRQMVQEAQRVRCWYLYPLAEVQWMGSTSDTHLMHRMEELCPNFSSSRNAYQAVLELLARKVRKSRSVGRFWYPEIDGGVVGDVVWYNGVEVFSKTGHADADLPS